MKAIVLTIWIISIASMNVCAKTPMRASYIYGDTTKHYQKPGAPIDIRYKTRYAEKGEDTSVDVEFITPLQSGELQVTVKTQRNLRIRGATVLRKTFSLAASSPKTMTIPLRAQGEGLFYVRIQAVVPSYGFRVFAVPVYIGRQSTSKKAATLRQKNKRRLITLPAEERIVTQRR